MSNDSIRLYDFIFPKRYKVLSTARHSETLEEFVIYQALYGKNEVWVRPVAMFLENIEIDGQFQPRFKQVLSIAQFFLPSL